MAESNSPTIRAVSWFELFPWLGIVRAFRLAIAARALVLGAVGILLTVVVWGVIGLIFGTDPTTATPTDVDAQVTGWVHPYTVNPWSELARQVPNRPGVLDFLPERSYLPQAGNVAAKQAASGPSSRASGVALPDVAEKQRAPVSIVAQLSAEPGIPVGPVRRCWLLLSAPATNGLSQTAFSLRSIVCVILCGLWGAAVWAFFGAAICRTAAVKLAADEQIGVAAALRFASRKWPSYFSAPLLPVCGVALATILIFILGLIMRSNLGLVLGGILWPLVLVAGFLMAVLLLGLLFGWPLMWAAISVEGTDSFDALSRTYAYVFQRPLRYLFYVVVAAVIGWLGWILVREFAAGVVWLGYWAAGWGCGHDQIDAILSGSNQLSGIGQFGARMIRFWAGCVKILAVGYLFSYFWSAAVAVYFQLRRDINAAETDEVFLDADASEEEPAPTPVAESGPAAGSDAPA